MKSRELFSHEFMRGTIAGHHKKERNLYLRIVCNIVIDQNEKAKFSKEKKRRNKGKDT